MLGSLFWTVVDGSKQELVVPAIQYSKISESKANVIAPITLFGRTADEQNTRPGKSDENVQKTRLNLKLLGVLVTPEWGVAIIENAGKSESYGLDETIQQGVVLKEVYPDYVVISHNGLLEKLQMITDESVFTHDTTSPELTPRQETILQNAKENALKNPISIMRYVRFQMIQKEGKVTSVKVWPRKEVDIFRSLGLMPGDELTSVDGHSVAELTQSPALWQTMLKKTNLDLTMIRNGQTQSVLVQLD